MLRYEGKVNPKKGFWQFHEAKAKLSEVLNKVEKTGEQAIVRNKKVFFIVTEDVFASVTPHSILDVFDRCPHPEVELDLTRSKETWRGLDL